MIICPSCRSEQMNGTMFCAECGSDLQTPAAPTFDLLQQIAKPSVLDAPVAPKPARSQQPNPSKSTLPPARPVPPPSRDAYPTPRRSQPIKRGFRMMVLNSGRVLDLPDQENVIIGRSDATSGDVPDVDLNLDNGVELGVSRRHACITFRDSQAYLTDLGSTNKTFINRQVMMRGQPYEIQDGDEVRLGNVIMKIMYNPASS